MCRVFSSLQTRLSRIPISRRQRQEITGLLPLCSLCHAAKSLTCWRKRNRSEAGRSRHDLRGTSSAKHPQSGEMANGACTADNQHLWVQECGQTEPGNQLGWKWCKFTFSEISWDESDAISSPLNPGRGWSTRVFPSARQPKGKVCSTADALTLLWTAIKPIVFYSLHPFSLSCTT